MLDLDDYPRPGTGVVGRVIEASTPGMLEAVVVLPTRGKINLLNDVGARIWSLVNGQLSGRQIAAIICEEYAVENAIAESDISEFLDDLVKRGAIVMGGQPIPSDELGS